MTLHRILIYGNAGSGKTTLARALAREQELPYLCLDHIAWGEAAVRLPLEESLARLRAFLDANVGWIIEGCYGDLLEATTPFATEVHFLNPSVEVCVANAKARPWDPEYCASPEDQQRYLAPLIEFIQLYPTRDDEYGLARHRAIYEAFAGTKREYTELP